MLLVHDAVFELGELGVVPAVGCSDEVTCDALYVVDVVAVAFGALGEAFLRILISAVHAAVAVVVDGAVADVVFVHEVDDVADGFGVVGGVAVNLDVEDVASARKFMIGCLDLGFVAG